MLLECSAMTTIRAGHCRRSTTVTITFYITLILIFHNAKSFFLEPADHEASIVAGRKIVVGMFDFKASVSGDLSFTRGDRMVILNK